MIRSVAAVLALLWTAPVVTEKAEVSDRGAIEFHLGEDGVGL